MRVRIAALGFCALLLGGCSPFLSSDEPGVVKAEQLARGYQPIDPEPVRVRLADPARAAEDRDGVDPINSFVSKNFTNTLTRIAIGRLDTVGTVRFGPVDVGHKGESYVVVVDRILYTAASVPIEYLLADLDLTNRLKEVAIYVTKDESLKKSFKAIPTDLTVQMMHDPIAGEYMGAFSQIGDERYRVIFSYAQSEKDFVRMAELIGAEAAETLESELRRVLISERGASGGMSESTFGPMIGVRSRGIEVLSAERDGTEVGTDANGDPGGGAGSAENPSMRSRETDVYEDGFDDDSAYSVPVYVGVGVRMRFELSVLKGDVNLTAYSSFGGQAAADRVRGTVTLQTIGISSESIANLIPSPIEISDSSVPIVLQALMTIFSKIYDDDSDVHLRPQVLGFDSPAVLHGGAAFLESVVRSRDYEICEKDHGNIEFDVKPKAGVSRPRKEGGTAATREP